MKKLNTWLCLLMAIVMAFSLVACTPDEPTVTDDSQESQQPNETDPTSQVDPTDETGDSVSNGETVVFTLSCDTADGWVTDVGGGTFGPFLDVGSIDTENQCEGEGCLYLNGDRTAEIGAFLGPSAVFQWTGTPVDTGLDRDNAAIRLSIYVSNPAAVDMACKVQIGSAGMPDVDNYEFILGNSADQTVCTHYGILEAGWNEITLNLSDAWKVGNPDLSAVNFIKFYALIMPAGCEVRIDNVRIVNLEG